MRDRPAEATPPSATRSAAAFGARWSVIALTGQHISRLLFLFLLARLIGPDNYGIVSQASIFLVLVTMIMDGGLGLVVIQRKELTERILGGVVALNTIAMVVFTLITFAVGPALAAFFRSPELVDVMRWLSLAVLLQGLTVVARGLLNRDLRYTEIAVGDLGGAIVGGIGGVMAALLGLDYFSVVIQIVVQSAVTAGIMNRYVRGQRVRPATGGIRDVLGYSGSVLGAKLLGFATKNGDNVLIGRYLGAAPLAFYTMSYRVMLIAVENLSMAINRVAMPLYSRLQDETDRVAKAYLQSVSLVSMGAFPFMAAVGLSAPDIVPFIFGPEWMPAVVPMQILSLGGMQQALRGLLHPIYNGLGRPQYALRFNLLLTVTSLSAFAVGIRWGLVGVAASFTSVAWLLLPVGLIYVRRLIGVTLSSYAATISPAAVSTVLGAAGWLTVRTLLDGALPDMVAAVASGVVFLTIYLLVLRLGWPSQVADSVSFVRLTLTRKQTAAATKAQV